MDNDFKSVARTLRVIGDKVFMMAGRMVDHDPSEASMDIENDLDRIDRELYNAYAALKLLREYSRKPMEPQPLSSKMQEYVVWPNVTWVSGGGERLKGGLSGAGGGGGLKGCLSGAGGGGGGGLLHTITTSPMTMPKLAEPFSPAAKALETPLEPVRKAYWNPDKTAMRRAMGEEVATPRRLQPGWVIEVADVSPEPEPEYGLTDWAMNAYK